MMVTLVIFLFVLAPVAAGAAVFLRWTRGQDPVTRLLLSLMPLSAAALVFSMAGTVAAGPLLDWNGAKLAPVLAMTYRDPTSETGQRYSLYPDPQTGPMTAWIYGPVAALVFLPSIVGRSPTGVIVAGIIINMLCTIPPALWLHLRALPPRRAADRRDPPSADPSADPPANPPSAAAIAGGDDDLPPERFAATRGQVVGFAMLMFLLFMWIGGDHESLRRAILMVGPDGPTVGLLACSCALLMTRRTAGSPPRSNVAMAGSAICAVLACWSKQSVLPFAAAPAVFLLLTDGVRVALRWLAMLAAAGFAISLVMLLSFNPKNLWFHMVTISASHHLQDNDHGTIVALWYGLGELLADCAQSIAMLVALLAIGAISGLLPGSIPDAARSGMEQAGAAGRIARPRLDRWRRWFRANPWTLLLMAAVVLVGPSVLGYAKIGGYYNNFSLTHYFLLAAATVGATWWWPRLANAALARLVCAAAAVVCLAAPIGQMASPGQITTMYGHLAHITDNQQEIIYRYAKTNPDVVYFPWNNLSTLLATGRLYHFEWGIYDRHQAKIPISSEQLRRHLPARVAAVAFSPLHQSQFAMAVFPKARARVAVTDLPDFVCYIEPPPAPEEPAGAPSPFRQGTFDLSPGVGGSGSTTSSGDRH